MSACLKLVAEEKMPDHKDPKAPPRIAPPPPPLPTIPRLAIPRGDDPEQMSDRDLAIQTYNLSLETSQSMPGLKRDVSELKTDYASISRQQDRLATRMGNVEYSVSGMDKRLTAMEEARASLALSTPPTAPGGVKYNLGKVSPTGNHLVLSIEEAQAHSMRIRAVEDESAALKQTAESMRKSVTTLEQEARDAKVAKDTAEKLLLKQQGRNDRLRGWLGVVIALLVLLGGLFAFLAPRLANVPEQPRHESAR